MYINNLSLDNFKALKDFGPIEFAPITLLCGSNSSGKSSFIQSILLLKQTFETRKSLTFPLNLSGHLKDFGKEFRNIVYNKLEEDIKIRFTLRHMLQTKEKQKELNQKFTIQVGPTKRIDEMSPDFCIKELTFSDESDVKIEIKSTSIPSEYLLSTKNIKRIGVNVKSGDLKDAKICLHFSGIIPSVDRQATVNITKLKKDDLIILFIIGEFFQSNLSSVFSKIKYIGPIRQGPERNKEMDITSEDIGIDGNNVNNILFLEQNKKRKMASCTIDKSCNFKLEDEVPFDEILEHWTNKMGIHHLAAKHDGVMVSLKMDSSEYSDISVNIADVGFGTSQVLPIIVESIRIGKDDLLLLEQPEIHLHPNLEMILADFFICMALTGRRFIIETHSKHLIDRIVKRIVQDKTGEFAKLIAINFFKKESEKGKGSTFEKINIDPTQGITSWPEDFFDKGGTELRDTLKASIEKMKGN